MNEPQNKQQQTRQPDGLVGSGFIMEAWPTELHEGLPVVKGFLRTSGPGGSLIRFSASKHGLAMLDAQAFNTEIRFGALIDGDRIEIRHMRPMYASVTEAKKSEVQ